MNKLQRTQAILGLIASNLNATDKETAEAFAAKHKPATSVKTVATTRKHLQEEMSGWSTVDLESFLQDCLADETFDDAYLDSDGNSQTLDSNSYRVITTSQLGYVWATSWRTVGNFPAAVQITYTAGYATIPARLKHAVKLLAAHWYENREDTTDRNLKLIPMGVSRLLGPFKVFGGV